MTQPARVRRLVMIESGKIRYADLALSGSAHLYGGNNRGKTTLISALRFLFIGNVRDMGMADKTVDESKEYFFRSEFSTMVFECQSRSGALVCVMVRSDGHLGRSSFSRYAYRGEYQRSDFIDEADAPRSLVDVKRILSSRGLTALGKDSDLESVITGVGASAALEAGLGLSLVPLKHSSEYRRFVVLFRQLLQLGTLDQVGLKTIFQAIYRNRLLVPPDGVDMRTESAEHFDRELALRTEVAALRSVGRDIEAMRDGLHRLRQARARLPAMFNRLTGLREERLKAAETTDAALNQRIVELDGKRQAVAGELSMARDALAALEKELAAKEALLSDHVETGVKEGFDQLLEEFETQALRETEARVNSLKARVQNAEAESPEELRPKRDAAERAIAALEDQLANVSSLLGTHLAARVPEAVLGAAFSVLNASLMRLKVGTEIDVFDERALSDLVNRIAGISRRVRDATVGAQLQSDLPPPDDIGLAVDPATLAAELEGLRRKLAVLLQRLKDAEKIAPLREELEKESADLASRAARLALYRSWRKKGEVQVPEWTKTVTGIKKQRPGAVASIASLERRGAAVREEMEALGKRINDLREEAGRLRRTHLRGADQDWLRHADPASMPALIESDFFTLYDQYERLFEDMVNATQELDVLTRSVGQRLPDVGQGETLEATAEALIDAADALPQKNEAHTKVVKDLVMNVRRRIADTLADLKRLADEIKLFSQKLSKVPISDLRSVGMELVENSEEVARLREMLDLSADDMFGLQDPVALDHMKRRIERQPKLLVSDLFGIRFRVQKVDGTTLLLQDIARVESNGTTVAIKVLVCLQMLREFMTRKHRTALPFYLDEVHALDAENLRRIVAKAKDLGFVPILASPQAGTVADTLHYLEPAEGGFSILTDVHMIERIEPAASPSSVEELVEDDEDDEDDEVTPA